MNDLGKLFSSSDDTVIKLVFTVAIVFVFLVIRFIIGKIQSRINVVLFLSLISISAIGQKYEREFHINSSQVPSTALEFVNDLTSEKVKWYGEQSEDGYTVEAKTKFKNKLHSIEFDSVGNLLDVEIIIPCEIIPEASQRKFIEYLNSEFDKHRIRKIQKQLIAEPKIMLSLLQGDESLPHEMNYEMIIKGQKDKQVNLYEFLFDEKGNIIERKQVVFSSSDHLEY